MKPETIDCPLGRGRHTSQAFLWSLISKPARVVLSFQKDIT
jgi:hypothetical protein